MDGPPSGCAFCDGGADEEIEIVTMADYASTNLGEEAPAYHVGLCWHHMEQLRENNEKLAPGEALVSTT